MSYVAPPTFIALTVLTAPQLNILSNDIDDLDRRTSPSGAVVSTSQTTTATAYTDLATVGPGVAVRIGSTGKALVSMHSAIANHSTPVASYVGFAITGPTSSIAANDATAIGFTSPAVDAGIRVGTTILVTGLEPGSTTFTCKYRMDPATGPATFADRRIQVTPLGA